MAYGISLVPPPGALLYEGPSVVWDDPRGFSISFEIVYSDTRTTLKELVTSTMVQAGFANNTPRLITEEGKPVRSEPLPESIAERPGARLFFEFDPDGPDDRPRVFGQVIIMLEPYAAAVLKLNAPKSRFVEARDTFNQVVSTVHVPLGIELNESREQRVDDADAWLKGIGTETLHAALPELQWYRLLFNGIDVGHLRFASTQDPEVLRRRGHQPPGTYSQINRRQIINGQTVDTLTTMFVSADGDQEEWSTKTTLRDPEHGRAGLAGNPAPVLATWAETGVRGDRKVGDRDVHALTVITDSPPPSESVVLVEQNKRFVSQRRRNEARKSTQANEWEAPKRAYLSQTDLWVFAGLLPKEPGEYCFTAFHSRTGKPGLRLVEVIPLDGGGVTVRDRPNSRFSPIEHVYNRDGKLVRRTDPSGLSLVPTTHGELMEIWEDKLD
ncbi:MAG: hypothetical protein AAF333_09710 [Planctomycetota bacterium]